jgi:hypothetical protein
VYGLAQTHYGLIVTGGYLKGELNCLADAASRNFQCPNGHLLETQLRQLPHQFPVCQTLLKLIDHVAISPSLPISALTRLSLTALGAITSYVSASCTI